MRTIGIDLAVAGQHKAIVADERGRFVTPPIKFTTLVSDLDKLFARAREGDPDGELVAIMEPTGMAWLPIAVYLVRRGVTVYLVNSQQVADLRRYYKRHAKSDRIDARVLTRLLVVNPEHLHQLTLASALTLACQRGCKQLDRLSVQITAVKNRLRDTDRFAWPGLSERVFPEPFSAAARWFREHWYNPQRVVEAGAETIRHRWQASGLDRKDDGLWAEALVELAGETLALYGTDSAYLDFDQLQAEVSREQKVLATFEELRRTVERQTVRPLYREIHPSRHLETIKGVGVLGAAVYASFAHDTSRFDSGRAFRGWSGMVPDSKQSAGSEAKGLHITQAGPDLVKKLAFLDAETARQRDPQIAAIYYDQMVNRGKHHKQAVCACATHLLDRVFVVLRKGKPYELRDVAGAPVTAEQALAIIREQYTVPKEVRERNNKRCRRERAERRAEREQERESHQAGERRARSSLKHGATPPQPGILSPTGEPVKAAHKRRPRSWRS